MREGGLALVRTQHSGDETGMVNILVVDDSTVDQKVAAGLLQKDTDWHVQFAKDGRVALDMLRSGGPRPDAIVTDLQMPEMNGLELVRKVKTEFPLIPIILMTAQGSETIAVEALKQGAASYVPKSKLADMLSETVEQVLSIAGENRTRRALFHYMEQMTCRFEVENDPGVLSSLVSYLQGILKDMNVLTENDRLRAGVALEEALLNAAYHGNLEVSSDLRENDHSMFYEVARQRTQQSPYRERRVHIDVQIDHTGLTYVVRDDGPGFDPNSLPDPTDPANLERPSGRGVLLMRTFMDEVIYNDRGNEVTLRKLSAKTTTSS